MKNRSAGILPFCRKNELKVWLVHPGGPYWKRKDEGAWSIPKGEYVEGEDLQTVALREFEEETGQTPAFVRLIALQPVEQKSGKWINAWAAELQEELEWKCSNNFTIEWPPRSGQVQTFPEVDKAAWFTIEEAGAKINPAQLALVHELEEILQQTK